MNILLLSLPDPFEHMPTVAVRMPNSALTSLAGNIDPQHNLAVADLVLDVGRRAIPGFPFRCRSHLLDVPSRRRLLFCACPHFAPLVAFEELYRAFVFLSFGQRRKRAQVAAFASFRILLPRIQPVLSGFQFADHACQLSIVL
jgi:hypothetical protein